MEALVKRRKRSKGPTRIKIELETRPPASRKDEASGLEGGQKGRQITRRKSKSEPAQKPGPVIEPKSGLVSELNQRLESRPIRGQIGILQYIFPSLQKFNERLVDDIETGRVVLPAGAEGWYAIINEASAGWASVIRPKHPKLPSEGEHCETILRIMKKLRNGLNVLENCVLSKMSKCMVRSSEVTRSGISRLVRAQSCTVNDGVKNTIIEPDILIMPGQIGKPFAFRRNSRGEILNTLDVGTNEFPLGISSVGCILLTHPQIFGSGSGSRLAIMSAGDEVDNDLCTRRYIHTPYIHCVKKVPSIGSVIISDTGIPAHLRQHLVTCTGFHPKASGLSRAS